MQAGVGFTRAEPQTNVFLNESDPSFVLAYSGEQGSEYADIIQRIGIDHVINLNMEQCNSDAFAMLPTDTDEVFDLTDDVDAPSIEILDISESRTSHEDDPEFLGQDSIQNELQYDTNFQLPRLWSSVPLGCSFYDMTCKENDSSQPQQIFEQNVEYARPSSEKKHVSHINPVTTPEAQKIENPAVTVEALLSKLICPICYRNFKRKKTMVNYSNLLKIRQSGSKKKKIQELQNAKYRIERALKELMQDEKQFSLNQQEDIVSSNNNEKIGEINEAFSDTLDCPSPLALSKKRSRMNESCCTNIHENEPSLTECDDLQYTAENQLTSEYETSDIRVGPCGHVYCEKCIKKYISSGKKCPVCNQALMAKKLYPLFL